MKIPPKTILFVTSIVIIVIGAVMSGLWPHIFNNILKSQLRLTKESTSFNLWKETPIPMYIEFYLFNCTNSEEVLNFNEHIKPELEELGPYVFSEEHSKVNISWNKNRTITFNQIRRWKFIPELSNGSLDDNITNLNVMALATSYMARHYDKDLQGIINVFLKKEGSFWITKPVRQLLFEGYDDKILYWLRKLESLLHIHIPFDKFGWFYMRNNSWTYDGVFNMKTGIPNLSVLGNVESWNYYTKVPYYADSCADVNGTAGELWPPGEYADNVTMFVSDLCRSMTLDFENETSVHGVTGRKFSAGVRVIDNGTQYPENYCFCKEGRFPSGVFDVSLCKNGAPAYISYPNFYLADQYYLDKVTGMKPDKHKHEFQITLEPYTGIPLNVSARLQINLHLQPYEHFTFYKGAPDLFMPMLWFTERAAITEELSSQIKMLLVVPVIGTGTFFGILGIGIFLLIIGILMTVRGNWKSADRTSLIPTDKE